MENETEEKLPEQVEGQSSDTAEERQLADPEEARKVYRQVRERLLSVHEWGNISKGISATFILTDQVGDEKKGPPEIGDHFRIDIPGPGTSAGEGYDWVRVEVLEEERSDEDGYESLLIQVRPSANPAKPGDTAHFFDSNATSTFLVKRENTIITAEVHGRNEKPNTSSEKTGDKIRNAVVGTGAGAGLSKIQWRKLVRGLLYGE